MEKIGKYLFRAEQYQCNFRKQLFFSYLVNQFLCSADYHSTERNFGTEQLNSIGKTWVLSRLAVEIKYLPSRHEEYYIETWVDSTRRYFTNRNFRISTKEGEVIGYGKSIWAILDNETREAQDIFKINNGNIRDFIVTPEEADKYGLNCSIENTNRVNLDDHLVLFRGIDTYYNDVDFNNHINSGRYIEHVLNLFSMDWHKKNIIYRFDIVFAAESYPNDKLNFYCSSPTVVENKTLCDQSKPMNEYRVRITKLSPNSAEEVESCRCRVIWREL